MGLFGKKPKKLKEEEEQITPEKQPALKVIQDIKKRKKALEDIMNDPSKPH